MACYRDSFIFSEILKNGVKKYYRNLELYVTGGWTKLNKE
jgi:hypothetical protein